MNRNEIVRRFVSEGEIIDSNAKLNRRRRDWSEWRKRLQELLGSEPEFAKLGLKFELDTLSDDIERLKEFSAQLVSESQKEKAVTSESKNYEELDDGPKPEDSAHEFSIFISHKSERDAELATLLKDKLRNLSDKKITVFLSQEIPGGEPWQDWVERNVIKCDMLLLLHTSEHEDNRWLLYEAGVYRGSRNANRHLVCLKNPHLEAPPPQLTNLEAIEATEQGIRDFLMDLLYRSTYTPGWQINPVLLDEDGGDFEDAVKQIDELFFKVQISVDYFRNRLEIGPISEISGDDSDSMDKVLVTANDVTRQLLGLADGELEWGDVCKQRNAKGDLWPMEVNEAVDLIQQRLFFSQVLTPINSTNGRICYPVISRVERIKQMPKNVTVIFVERELTEPEGNFAEELTRAPDIYLTIVSLLNLARRFRWNILNQYIGLLDGFRGAEVNMEEVSAEIWVAIERLESDAGDYVMPGHVLPIFPETYRETIEALFTDYGAARESLKQAIEKQDRPEIVAALRFLEPLNKRFLLGGIKLYYSLIQKLPPVDIMDEDVFGSDVGTID